MKLIVCENLPVEKRLFHPYVVSRTEPSYSRFKSFCITSSGEDDLEMYGKSYYNIPFDQMKSFIGQTTKEYLIVIDPDFTNIASMDSGNLSEFTKQFDGLFLSEEHEGHLTLRYYFDLSDQMKYIELDTYSLNSFVMMLLQDPSSMVGKVDKLLNSLNIIEKKFSLYKIVIKDSIENLVSNDFKMLSNLDGKMLISLEGTKLAKKLLGETYDGYKKVYTHIPGWERTKLVVSISKRLIEPNEYKFRNVVLVERKLTNVEESYGNVIDVSDMSSEDILSKLHLTINLNDGDSNTV